MPNLNFLICSLNNCYYCFQTSHDRNQACVLLCLTILRSLCQLSCSTAYFLNLQYCYLMVPLVLLCPSSFLIHRKPGQLGVYCTFWKECIIWFIHGGVHKGGTCVRLMMVYMRDTYMRLPWWCTWQTRVRLSLWCTGKACVWVHLEFTSSTSLNSIGNEIPLC